MIPLGGRYTRIIRAFNSSLWYLPKLIQLILTLGKREYLDYLALYKCKHPCSETIYFNWFGAGRSVDISSVRPGDVMLNGWGFDCPASSVAAWDLAERDFLSVHAAVHNTFHVQRHLTSRRIGSPDRTARFSQRRHHRDRCRARRPRERQFSANRGHSLDRVANGSKRDPKAAIGSGKTCREPPFLDFDSETRGRRASWRLRQKTSANRLLDASSPGSRSLRRSARPGDARRQREQCSPAGPLPPPLRRKRPRSRPLIGRRPRRGRRSDENRFAARPLFR